MRKNWQSSCGDIIADAYLAFPERAVISNDTTQILGTGHFLQNFLSSAPSLTLISLYFTFMFCQRDYKAYFLYVTCISLSLLDDNAV